MTKSAELYLLPKFLFLKKNKNFNLNFFFKSAEFPRIRGKVAALQISTKINKYGTKMCSNVAQIVGKSVLPVRSVHSPVDHGHFPTKRTPVVLGHWYSRLVASDCLFVVLHLLCLVAFLLDSLNSMEYPFTWEDKSFAFFQVLWFNWIT